MQEIDVVLEHHSKILQSSTLTAEEAMTCLAKVKLHNMGDLKTDEQFRRILGETEGLTKMSLSDEPAPKRLKKPPSKLSEFFCTTQQSYTVEETDPTKTLRLRCFRQLSTSQNSRQSSKS